MKSTALISLFVFFSTVTAWSADYIEVSDDDKEIISRELQKESSNESYSEQTRNILLKAASIFKNSNKSTEVVVTPEIGSDCVNCQKSSRVHGLLSKLKKPFLKTTGFFQGLLESEKTDPELEALKKFVMDHEEDFGPLFLDSKNSNELADLIIAKSQEDFKKDIPALLREFALAMKLNRPIPENINDLNLTVSEIAALNLSAYELSKINNHPAYKKLKVLFGELTSDDLIEMATTGNIERIASVDGFKEYKPNTHASLQVVSTELFAPKIALNVISKSSGEIFGAPLLSPQLGKGVSAAICHSLKVRRLIKTDNDLRLFCGFVTSDQVQGHQTGKKVRQNISEKWSDVRNSRGPAVQ